jgi:hypothetical protein
MTRTFFVSYVYDRYTGEKNFDNSTITIDVTDEKQLPILLQQKLSLLINKSWSSSGRFFPVTLINFWEI